MMLKAIDLLREYDVNPSKFVVAIVDLADSDNLQVFLADENLPHMIEDNQFIAFVPVSKPSLNKR